MELFKNEHKTVFCIRLDFNRSSGWSGDEWVPSNALKLEVLREWHLNYIISTVLGAQANTVTNTPPPPGGI